MSIPLIRTLDRQCEVAWFSALCSDDYEFLGVPDGALRSSYEHCGEIVRKADALGYQNILLPSGWIAGQDALAFAAALAPQTRQINQLVALRMGEVWPPMLARAIATVDHIARGRLCINIISSDMPGGKESNEVRYARASEIIQILQALWRTDGPFEWKGEFYTINLPNTDAARPYQQNGGPLMYFGGISPAAQNLCAKHCDVFLMWPETEDRIAETMRVMAEKAAGHGRKLEFGFRSHVIVRETEAEARAAADRLISKLDAAKGAGNQGTFAWTARAPGCCGRMNCARRARISSSRGIFGAASASRAAAAAAPSWVTPIRCSPSSTATWTWAFEPLS